MPVASASADANLTVRWRLNQTPEFVVPPIALRMGGRTHPLLQLAQLSAALLRRRQADGQLVVQLHDEDPGPGSLRMDAPRHAAKPQNGVIPDAYCLGAMASCYFVSNWSNSLTAMAGAQANRLLARRQHRQQQITIRTVGNSRRYQLCQLTRRRPDLLDARFSNVVQCASARINRQWNST